MYTIIVSAILIAISAFAAEGLHIKDSDSLARAELSKFFKLPSDESAASDAGTRWAVLVAGSAGYENYRHQADICHAYQLLRKGGLKDENIIVFMYDDIADDEENLHKGRIYNRPGGPDVYQGVPKDYTGDNATAVNLYAAILGDKSGITGGSGKVVASGPNDHIFIYYADHGGTGIVAMPSGPYIFANDLNRVLKEKHDKNGYKRLVFYMEACESASMFDGLLKSNINIYAVTSANADESSWAFYCPYDDPDINIKEYNTCLGDLFSISWMEDVEEHDRSSETLEEDFDRVEKETGHPSIGDSSHVMRFGDITLTKDHLSVFMGVNKGSPAGIHEHIKKNTARIGKKPLDQYDADLAHFYSKLRTATNGSKRQAAAQKELDEVLDHRRHIDTSIALIGSELLGVENLLKLKSQTKREAGQSVVNDWNCFKSMVRTFETYCGALSQYGLKHMHYLVNFCNAGIGDKQMATATARVCTSFPTNPRSSLARGFSA